MLTQLEEIQLVELLELRVAGNPFPHSFIHEVDPYSAVPDDLVRSRSHDPGSGQGDGKAMVWYFCCLAKRKRVVQTGSAGAGAGAGETCWHTETGKKDLPGPDTNKPVTAYRRTLSYVCKMKDPRGAAAAKQFRLKRLGWCMVELWLQKQDDDADQQQLVLCKLYRSARSAEPEACTEASSSVPAVGGGDVPFAPPPACIPPTKCEPIEISMKPDERIGSSSNRFRSGLVIMKKKKSSATEPAVIMNLGGSSIRSAERMKEMAKLILSFPTGAGGGDPVVVLSAIGNTNTNLLMAAAKALRCGAGKVRQIDELAVTKQLHLRTTEELGLDSSIVSGSFDELGRVLCAVSMMDMLTAKTRDFLASFGERICTTIFAALLNELGKEAGQEWELHDVNIYGMGGSDLTATTIGRDLGSREILVWEDIDGVMTCDPSVCPNAIPHPYLTFNEAFELGFFCAQSMQLAMEGGISVKVKNSYKPQAPGTVITKTRDMSKSVVTSIVLKSNITLLDIRNARMLKQSNFIETVLTCFSTFKNLGILVDYFFANEVKISLTIAPSKLSSRELVQLELGTVVEELKQIADVDVLQDRSVISLIGNAQMWPLVFGKASNVLWSADVKVQMMSQALSVDDEVMKVSYVVGDDEAEDCVRTLHSAFFEGEENEHPVHTSSSGVKRKADEREHPESPPGVRQEREDTDSTGDVEETERAALQAGKSPIPVRDDSVGDPKEYFESILNDNIVPIRDDHLVPPIEVVDDGFEITADDFNRGISEVQPQQQQQQVISEVEGGNGVPGVLEDVAECSHHGCPMEDALEDALEDAMRWNPTDHGYQTLFGMDDRYPAPATGYQADAFGTCDSPRIDEVNNGGSAPGVLEVADYSIDTPMMVVGVDNDNHGIQEDVNIEELLGDI